MLLNQEIPGIHNFLSSEEFAVDFDLSLEKKLKESILGKLKERTQIKMFIFRIHLTETIAKYLGEIINSDKKHQIFLTIHNYLRELRSQVGVKIHPVYLGYTMSRIASFHNIYDYNRSQISNFLRILDGVLTCYVTASVTQDHRILMPKGIALEIHSIGFNYLVMLMDIKSLDTSFLSAQLLVALRFCQKFQDLDKDSFLFVGPVFQLFNWLVQNWGILSQRDDVIDAVYQVQDVIVRCDAYSESGNDPSKDVP